jgi:hypothetical protein
MKRFHGPYVSDTWHLCFSASTEVGTKILDYIREKRGCKTENTAGLLPSVVNLHLSAIYSFFPIPFLRTKGQGYS